MIFLSFPNALIGNPDEVMTGPPMKTSFGGDNLRITPWEESFACLASWRETKQKINIAQRRKRR
jgi:hypothetical protein